MTDDTRFSTPIAIDKGLTRRSVLAAGAALAAFGLPRARPAKAESSGVPFGAMIQSDYFRDNAAYRQAFLDHCDMIVPGAELKFDQIRPERDVWRLEPAETLVDFAMDNGRTSRGHTHVWWNSVPPWLEAISDRREGERVLIEHIERVTDHFRGQLLGWDVVNEVIAHDPLQEGPLRRSKWLQLLGPRHIPLAFEATARTDPNARLVVNDYDLEFAGPRFDKRREIMLTIVRQMLDANIRVGGVGIQGHLYGDRQIDIDALTRFHKDLDALGVELLVTELDVINRESAPDPASMDALAGKLVGDLMDGIFAWKPPAAVVTWGITDRYSWIPDEMPRYDGEPHRPLPLDRDYRPKAWFDALKARLLAAS